MKDSKIVSHYLEKRDDLSLDLLIRRFEAAKNLSDEQAGMLVNAKRILAKRSAAKVGPYFDVPRVIKFL